MQLCYRGVRYEHQPTQIEVSGTGQPVKFRGKTYKSNQAILDLKEINKEDFVYRGVAICEKKHTKFLGQFCARKSCNVDLGLASKKKRFLGQVSDNNFGTLITVTSAV